jgi:chromosome segregation ATPase
VSGNAPSASEKMACLIAEREKARDRVDAIEAEWRASTEQSATASAALTEFERQHPSGRAAERDKLERELTDAQAKASAPWPEKIAGARQRVADAHGAVRAFAAEHLDELVAEREAEGAAVAAKLTSAAEDVAAAYNEREQIANELGQLCTLAGARVRPGDVTFSRASELATAASVLIQAGGEVAPALRRDPRQSIHTAPPEPATAA